MKFQKFAACAIHAGLVALMCLSSIIKISFAFTPVPVTMQSVVCLISGSLLGATGGASLMIIYILLGALGLPVFAGMNSGIEYILGPTGGYVIGFIPAAFIAGKLTRFFYKPYGSLLIQIASIFISHSIATIVLYFFGTVYFSVLTANGIVKSALLAVLPFVWIDLAKIIASSLIVRQLLQIMEINRIT